MPNSVNGTSAHTEIRGENGPLASRLSGSPKIIGSDKDRSGAYDFLLVIFHTVSEIKDDFVRKSQYSVYLTRTPAEGVAIKFL